MATIASLTTGHEVGVLQADGLVDPLHFETQLEANADWGELIEIVRDANELVRLARALVPAE
jgi:hypothetical protein